MPAGSVPPRHKRLFETEEEAMAYAAELAPRLSSIEPVAAISQMTLAAALERYFETQGAEEVALGRRTNESPRT